MNPAKAVFTSKPPVTTRPIQTIIDVTPSGIFSNTNMITANRRNRRVIVDGLICFPPFLRFFFLLLPDFFKSFQLLFLASL